jgi:oxamate amidohydrolase
VPASACGAAAEKSEPELYSGSAQIPWRGPLAANTVAGTVSGWGEALKRGGAGLPLERLLRDAIDASGALEGATDPRSDGAVGAW